MSGKSWAELEETTSIAGIKFMFWVYRLLGRKVFAVFLAPVIVYFFLANGTARRASFDYLSRLRQQGMLNDRRPLWWLSLCHFMSFGSSLLDQLAAWSGSKGLNSAVFEGQDQFVNTVRSGNGALVLVAHLGNLEASRAVADNDDIITFNVLVHSKNAVKFNELLHSVHERRGLRLIQVTEMTPATAIMLNENLQNHEAVVVAADRTPVNGGDRQVEVEFLGDTALLPQGPYVLASLLQCPVYLLFCVREKSGFRIFIEPFAEKIRLHRKARESEAAQWAQKYAQRLEYYLRQYPLQWFNFYDFWSAPTPTDQTDSTSDIKKTSL